MPIIMAKDPSPRTLNNGFMKMLKILPRKYGKFVFIRSSVATKKGNSVGTTDIAHSFKPVFAAKIFEEENNIKQNVNSNNTNCNKKFFNFIIKNFIINSVPSI